MAPSTEIYYSSPHWGVRLGGRWEDVHCSNGMACLSGDTLPQHPPNDGRHDKSEINLQSMPKYRV